MPTELQYTPLSEVKSVSYGLENAYPDTTTHDPYYAHAHTNPLHRFMNVSRRRSNQA